MTRENIKRPLVHFSPKKGWMNDPNGPVFYKGEYHLFFQHNPDNVYWDNMHWGHAKSKDLIHWEELPIALFPDEQGMIFSGSAFVDKRNDSGLGKEDSPALLLFYTSHDHKTMREMQCMAYTTDGTEFIKYDKNPLIGGKEHTPARDPHVFENKIIGGYSMCFTIENAIVFYHSTNLLSWEKTGEFKLPEYALQGMIECPCMLEFEKYVLMMSMDVPESEYNKFPKNAEPHSRTMQYFYGDFNGYTFVPDKEQNEVLLVDYGKDFYAGTVFSNIKEKILIAWMGDFSKEAKKVKTEEEGFKGTLSYPRKIELRKTSEGYRLHHEFYPCPEGTAGIFYEKNEEEEKLTDRIILETIKENGFIPSTNYMVK
jgi:fructan beta-fructosidase